MANLTRYSDRPLDLFSQLRREMDDVFANWITRPSGSSLVTSLASNDLFTPCELQETEAEFIARVDVPGVPEKDLKVSFQGDTLTVQGERKEQKTETKGNVRYSERSYGSFSRAIAIPAAIKADEIRARYKDGVMEVHLPKAQKTAAREIKVER